MRYTRYIGLMSAAVVAALMVLPVRAGANDVTLGETIATEACSSCHQVKRDQAIPPPVPNPDAATQVPAPSFLDIAARDHGADQLRALILNPPHPMREQHWNEADLKAVIAYIQSLDQNPDR